MASFFVQLFLVFSLCTFVYSSPLVSKDLKIEAILRQNGISDNLSQAAAKQLIAEVSCGNIDFTGRFQNKESDFSEAVSARVLITRDQMSTLAGRRWYDNFSGCNGSLNIHMDGSKPLGYLLF